jgi:hypothetical protein
MERMALQSAIEIIGAHVPLCNGIRQALVALHYDLLAVVRRMITANGIGQRAVPHKRAVV